VKRAAIHCSGEAAPARKSLARSRDRPASRLNADAAKQNQDRCDNHGSVVCSINRPGDVKITRGGGETTRHIRAASLARGRGDEIVSGVG
jgi:hypothetical protein